jgi:hypothetical protein
VDFNTFIWLQVLLLGLANCFSSLFRINIRQVGIVKFNAFESGCVTIGEPAVVRNNSGGRVVSISDFDGGKQSCWVKNCALVLDSDGEDVQDIKVRIRKNLKTEASRSKIGFLDNYNRGRSIHH